ncbi:MAG: methylamine utilization protein [Porphyrobacter sp.]|nr:methylamine utilization protein [Porphyrobacter sp.]
MNSGLRLILGLLVLCSAGLARAGDLTVVVRDSGGRPVADAVVMADVAGQPAPAPGHFVISQKSMAFVPFVLVIPVGSTVEFGNLDPFRHHVYSFSPAKEFELKLFGQGQTRPVRFDKPGLVAIGYNIHDSMQAFIQVVTTPFAVKTDGQGRATLHGVSNEVRELRVWHPYLRAPGNQLVLKVDGSKTATIPVSVSVRRPAPMRHDY